MPSSGPSYVPSAANAQGPSWGGRTVQDTVTYLTYDASLCTAKHLPYEIQNEVLNLIKIAYTGGGAIPVFNASAQELPASAMGLTGIYSASNGITTFTIAEAEAESEIPASGLLLSSLAPYTAGTIYAGGTFTSELDTTDASIGDYVYVATDGGLTLEKPNEEDVNYIQIIGRVQTLANPGVISGLVMPARWIVKHEECEEEAMFV